MTIWVLPGFTALAPIRCHVLHSASRRVLIVHLLQDAEVHLAVRNPGPGWWSCQHEAIARLPQMAVTTCGAQRWQLRFVPFAFCDNVH